jgi:glucuronyl/N-acetylglucosaminyl transferase EXT1
MDACFDYSRCANRSELLVYSYTAPSAPLRYFARMANRTAWHTDDPRAACVFLAYLETNPPYPMDPHPSALPHWGANGSNHVLVTFADKWKDLGLAAESIGYAAVMASDMHETVYRPGFDVSITLPGLVNAALEPLLLGTPPGPRHRRYLATFRGLRYLNSTLFMEGTLRSYASFRGMHNGADVVVATSCRHGNNDAIRRHNPSAAAHCDDDQAVYDAYSYTDLRNPTFGLVPAGWSPNSYRLVEVLSAGAIPVLIVDNYVKPFDALIQWHRCALQFPSSQIGLIVPTLRAMVARHLRHSRRRRHGADKYDGDRNDNDNDNDDKDKDKDKDKDNDKDNDKDDDDDDDIHDELSRRRRYCVHIYKRYLRDDDTLLASAIASLKARLYGAVPYDDPPLK